LFGWRAGVYALLISVATLGVIGWQSINAVADPLTDHGIKA
jgi:hypothetical protein